MPGESERQIENNPKKERASLHANKEKQQEAVGAYEDSYKELFLFFRLLPIRLPISLMAIYIPTM